METLLVTVNTPEKASLLAEMLSSLDFVSSVNLIDDVKKAKQLFEEVNQIASKTELSELTMEDIITEIKTHRREKKSGSN